jgi:hypothetical protein
MRLTLAIGLCVLSAFAFALSLGCIDTAPAGEEAAALTTPNFFDKATAAAFADSQWNCTDPTCKYHVLAGDSQEGYRCAEFVSRVVAAGGGIPGINPYTSTQLEMDPFKPAGWSAYTNGLGFDLLWIADYGLFGIKNYLNFTTEWDNLGAISTDQMQQGDVLVVYSSVDGYEGHGGVVIGRSATGAIQIDAHNDAALHATDIGAVEFVYRAKPQVCPSWTAMWTETIPYTLIDATLESGCGVYRVSAKNNSSQSAVASLGNGLSTTPKVSIPAGGTARTEFRVANWHDGSVEVCGSSLNIHGAIGSGCFDRLAR